MNLLEHIGTTTKGRQVIRGVFKLVGTYGTPLEVVLEYFKSNDKIVDWLDYIDNALADGHRPSTIKSRILAAVGEVYVSKYKNEFEERLNVFVR